MLQNHRLFNVTPPLLSHAFSTQQTIASSHIAGTIMIIGWLIYILFLVNADGYRSRPYLQDRQRDPQDKRELS